VDQGKAIFHGIQGSPSLWKSFVDGEEKKKTECEKLTTSMGKKVIAERYRNHLIKKKKNKH